MTEGERYFKVADIETRALGTLRIANSRGSPRVGDLDGDNRRVGSTNPSTLSNLSRFIAYRISAPAYQSVVATECKKTPVVTLNTDLGLSASIYCVRYCFHRFSNRICNLIPHHGLLCYGKG